MQPVTAAMLEEFVFSKPYFDREGLIVALEGARPIGFVHAAAGARPDGTGTDPKVGVIAMLVTEAGDQAGEVTIELLHAACDYLKRRGAQRILAGAAPPHDPFYLGLYGGSVIAGVLEHERLLMEALRAEQFRPVQTWQFWRRTIADFHPPIDRQQRQLRLKFELSTTVDPATESWWEACQWGSFVRTRYDLVPRGGGVPLASAWMWDIVPLSRTWGRHAAGFIRWQATAAAKNYPGALAFLCAEVLSFLQQENIALAAAAVEQTDTELTAMYQLLGFEGYTSGFVFEKSAV